MKNTILWILKGIAALIMLQTLYFKFTANETSVMLFTELGMEPYGRIGIGVLELIASILLLVPKSSIYGAVLAMGLMAGAIFFHLTKLGIVFQGDSLLFIYASVVFACATIIAWYEKSKLEQILLKFYIK